MALAEQTRIAPVVFVLQHVAVELERAAVRTWNLERGLLQVGLGGVSHTSQEIERGRAD